LPIIFASKYAFAVLIVKSICPFAGGYVEVSVCGVEFDVVEVDGLESANHIPCGSAIAAF
jgi:hypothetical protein